MAGELPRGEVAQGHVRSTHIVVPAPSLDLDLSILKGHEPVGVEAFIPQAAVKRFDVSVVRGLSRSGKIQRDLVIICP